MSKTMQSGMVLAVVLSLTSLVGFAQSSGEATYKAKCTMCHGPSGAAESPMAKMLKVKPVSDPEIKKLTSEQMFASVKNGKGKMQPFSGKLTDAQIKEAVAYYRGLK